MEHKLIGMSYLTNNVCESSANLNLFNFCVNLHLFCCSKKKVSVRSTTTTINNTKPPNKPVSELGRRHWRYPFATYITTQRTPHTNYKISIYCFSLRRCHIDIISAIAPNVLRRNWRRSDIFIFTYGVLIHQHMWQCEQRMILCLSIYVCIAYQWHIF